MKLNTGNIIKKIVAYLSLLLVVVILYNNAVYPHTHKLSNGELVTHAHPFNKSPGSSSSKSHKHSNAELLFFANMDLLFTILLLTFAWLAIDNKKAKLKLLSRIYSFVSHFTIKGRAPPVFAC